MARAWRRPQAEVTGPDRSFGGYYRTADRDVGAAHLRGVPLQTAEAAAVAAVRLGYNIVDAQIERGLTIARRLRSGADRVGVPESGQVLTLAENLLNKGAMLGLEMLETAAAEPDSPMKRLFTAQFRMLGSLLGVDPGPAAHGADGPAREDASKDRPGQEEPRDAGVERDPAVSYRVRVRHGAGSAKRAVAVVRFTTTTRLRPSGDGRHLDFHLASGGASATFAGTLTVAAKEAPVLEVVTSRDQPSGRWRAAVCDADGEQVGIIEVEL